MDSFKHHVLNKIIPIPLNLIPFSNNKSSINVKVSLTTIDLDAKDSPMFINP
jgi:hypothetical protein